MDPSRRGRRSPQGASALTPFGTTATTLSLSLPPVITHCGTMFAKVLQQHSLWHHRDYVIALAAARDVRNDMPVM
ncbi:unnamed protein product [Closterium sp. NIES-53]